MADQYGTEVRPVFVNGKPAVIDGVVMIPPGAEVAVPIPGGLLYLRFKTEGDEGYTWDHWYLTVTAKENPLGIGLSIPLKAADGQPMTLALTIHTVGQGEAVYRIVHYTGYLG